MGEFNNVVSYLCLAYNQTDEIVQSVTSSATWYTMKLSDDPEEEILTGFEILKSLELRKEGAILVACPSCGRADVDVRKLANDVDNLLRNYKTPIKVAVMGCEVNGPGEAKDADVGIAAGAGRAIIFRKGVKSRIVDESEMLEALMAEIKKVETETPSGR